MAESLRVPVGGLGRISLVEALQARPQRGMRWKLRTDDVDLNPASMDHKKNKGPLVTIARARATVSLENEEGLVVLNAERFQIFKAVHKAGSMSKAADMINKPFRSVWSIIKETEAHCGVNLVEKGPNGSRLTLEGYRLLQKYEELAKSCKRSANSKFRKLFFT